MKSQIVCAIKIRHRIRHDSIDFGPLLQKAIGVMPIDTVISDKDMIQRKIMSNQI